MPERFLHMGGSYYPPVPQFLAPNWNTHHSLGLIRRNHSDIEKFLGQVRIRSAVEYFLFQFGVQNRRHFGHNRQSPAQSTPQIALFAPFFGLLWMGVNFGHFAFLRHPTRAHKHSPQAPPAESHNNPRVSTDHNIFSTRNVKTRTNLRKVDSKFY